MNIDHASREPWPFDGPDPRDRPPDNPPDGPSITAERLFRTGSTASNSDMPKPFDLRPLVWAAVVLHGGQRNGTFGSRAFAEIIRMKFDLKAAPDDAWCARVLRGLDYIIEYPGMAGVWKVQTG